MKLKNNSNKQWLKYNCGKEIYVDILPNAEFEVKEPQAVALILKNLGHPNWITVYSEESCTPEVEVKKIEDVKNEAVAKAKVIESKEQKPKKGIPAKGKKGRLNNK